MSYTESVSARVNMSSDNSLFIFDNTNISEDSRLLLSNICMVESRFKWTSDFNELKRFVREFIGLVGRWSTPGGGSKQFRCPTKDVSLTWYHKKQTLLFQGKNGELLKSILVRMIGEATSPTANDNLLENTKEKPTTDHVLPADQTNVLPNIEIADDLIESVLGRDNRSCCCDTVLPELESMKLNIEVLQLRVDSLQSLANAQKVCSSMDGYINMIDCLNQELCEEKQKRLKMELDLKNLTDNNSDRCIQTDNEPKYDLLDNENFTPGELHALKATCVEDSPEIFHPNGQPIGKSKLIILTDVFKSMVDLKMFV